MPNSNACKARLAAQLTELKNRQGNIARDLAVPPNADASEEAVEIEDDASLEGQAALISRERTLSD